MQRKDRAWQPTDTLQLRFKVSQVRGFFSLRAACKLDCISEFSNFWSFSHVSKVYGTGKMMVEGVGGGGWAGLAESRKSNLDCFRLYRFFFIFQYVERK